MDSGLPGLRIEHITEDSEGYLWFATLEGVVRYDAHSISVFDLISKKPREISQLVQDSRGDIWIGCVSPVFNYLSESLFRLDGEHFEYVSTESGLDINNCFAIYEDSDGCLWFGGRNGLFRYDGQKIKEIQAIADVREKSICAITQNAQGHFLFGCWEGGKIKGKSDFFPAE